MFDIVSIATNKYFKKRDWSPQMYFAQKVARSRRTINNNKKKWKEDTLNNSFCFKMPQSFTLRCVNWIGKTWFAGLHDSMGVPHRVTPVITSAIAGKQLLHRLPFFSVPIDSSSTVWIRWLVLEWGQACITCMG